MPPFLRAVKMVSAAILFLAVPHLWAQSMPGLVIDNKTLAPDTQAGQQRIEILCIANGCQLAGCPKSVCQTKQTAEQSCGVSGCASVPEPEIQASCQATGGNTCVVTWSSKPAESSTEIDLGDDPKSSTSKENTGSQEKQTQTSQTETSQSKDISSPTTASTINSGSQQACSNARTRADQYCGGSIPSSYSGNTSGGINSYGNSLSSGALASANASYRWASQCSSAWTTCTQLCQGVDSSATSQCQAYSSKAASAANQSTQSMKDAQAAQQAGNSGGAGGGTRGLGSGDQNYLNGMNSDPTGCSLNPSSSQCQLCTQDPSHPSCGGNGESQARARPGFRENESTRRTLDDFNTPDPSSAGMAQYGYAAQAAAAVQGKTVPNGGGGGLPGADGSRAQLGAKGGARAAQAGNQADVFQGERGGSGWGGYGHGGPTNEFESQGARRGVSNGQRAPSGTPYDGMDLKKYLPGHGRDPRRMVGGMHGPAQDIMGRTADMFKQVSERFQERCRLGRLYDCR